ncbi:MAG: purine-nucleoside phosphorylase [Candidatus Aminicenantes bacterium]|nr:purine-nucleoside phosphorylase [Candidatus Aminicenantes bacterium]
MNIYEQLTEAVTFIKNCGVVAAEVGVVLGSGLGEFAESLEEKTVIPYEDIPHFKKVRVKGHAGQLVAGRLGGKPVVVMRGRYHYYEGYDIAEVVFPIRTLCGLGISKLLLTNAAGGINPDLQPGDLMIIRDHINMMGVNPLRGENDERIGARFPDMSGVYEKNLSNIIARGMQDSGLAVKQGVYAALSGPSYETPAEIKMLAVLGADAVGMSTVPEAIAARHMGVTVAGISCISNLAAGISKNKLDHKDVTETTGRIKNRFISLLSKTIPLF